MDERRGLTFMASDISNLTGVNFCINRFKVVIFFENFMCILKLFFKIQRSVNNCLRNVHVSQFINLVNSSENSLTWL